MTEVTLERTAIFAAPLEKLREARLPAGSARLAAAQRFEQVGLPGPKNEAWRSTPLGAVHRQEWQIAARPRREELEALRRQIEPWRLPDCLDVVFVDGWWIPELSAAELPAGLTFRTLGGCPEGSRLVGHGLEEQPFALLSSALFQDGGRLEVAPRAILDRPVHALFWSRAESGTARFPRLEIAVGAGAEARFVESHVGHGEGPYLSCPVTEVALAERSILEHVRIQRETRAGLHLARLAYALERSATLSSHSFSLGAELFRQDVSAWLGGEGSEATLNGLYLVEDRQHADTHMRVDHVAPHAASHELYKGVLDGRARSVFSGRIHVHPGAQKTDAKQTNRNLLLSREALAHSQPQLEIYADDVKCTHGSTVGQLDEDAVFYLRSRGIGVEAAQSLLTYAFAADVVERVGIDVARKELQEFLFRWVPQGDVVRDAV